VTCDIKSLVSSGIIRATIVGMVLALLFPLGEVAAQDSGPPVPIFQLSDLSISPSRARPGQTVEVSVQLSNIGAVENSCSVSLVINGLLEETKTVRLAPGASERVIFSVVKDVVGTYDVDVGAFSSKFTVVADTVPVRWAIIAPIIGAVAVTGLAIAIFITRGRRAVPKHHA